MPHAYYIGIDPGLTGAVARVTGEEVAFTDTPVIKSGKGRTLYGEIAMVEALRGMLRDGAGQTLPGHPLVVLELVHAMPKQGVSSSFSFGMGYGIWIGIIAALGLSHVRVDPRTWKKVVLRDVAKTDAAEVAVAGRAYPSAAARLVTPRGRLLTGRTDALLLAHYGRVAGL